ncbi:MAG: hypothetical protein JXL97_12205, partial [Bacteroidales bacterium]|nr:hypothetical protein [Bacteroidales bacterium]
MNKLFDEFQPVSTQEWLDIIKKDLKGDDIKKLMRKTIDGIVFEPFYLKENTENLSTVNTLPNQFPFLRGYKENNDWTIRQDFLFENIVSTKEKIETAVNRGIKTIGLNFGRKISLNQDEFDKLTEKISNISITVLDHVEDAYKLVKGSKNKFENVFIDFDPLTYRAFTGGYYENSNERKNNVLKLLSDNVNGIKTMGINLHHYANAGATPVMQLAFGLAITSEYLSLATHEKISIENAIDKIFFNIAIGCEYFMEIAKVRAFRYLFAKLIEAFNPELKDKAKTHIHGITTRRNKTIYDAHVNMLRTTIETLAGVVGGVDSFTTEPYNSVFAKSDEFAHRIAVNQQIVIKEEAYADKVADPSGGSYYVENLTVKLIEQAWELFLKIEEKGGFCASLKEGFIQNLVKEVAEVEQELADIGKIAILGTNKYPNQNENLSKTEIEKPISISDIDYTVIDFEPLKTSRLAQKFEELRTATEKSEKIPTVFLFTYGHKAMRRARADFAGNFFAVAGFKVIDNLGFDEIETGISKANESNADIIVLCSSD